MAMNVDRDGSTGDTTSGGGGTITYMHNEEPATTIPSHSDPLSHSPYSVSSRSHYSSQQQQAVQSNPHHQPNGHPRGPLGSHSTKLAPLHKPDKPPAKRLSNPDHSATMNRPNGHPPHRVSHSQEFYDQNGYPRVKNSPSPPTNTDNAHSQQPLRNGTHRLKGGGQNGKYPPNHSQIAHKDNSVDVQMMDPLARGLLDKMNAAHDAIQHRANEIIQSGNHNGNYPNGPMKSSQLQSESKENSDAPPNGPNQVHQKPVSSSGASKQIPSISPLRIDGNNDEDTDDDSECEYPLKVIAFDLDKTLVRTISLHNEEQPQPEQYENGYFMFFDEDTKEFHHVYKRPFLKELLEFLYAKVAATGKVKMMLCTHGTQKYAQTILERCGADKLFPKMLPRKDWSRRKFEDDYKMRRFKTLRKMAESVTPKIGVEDLLMIDDDPGVYCKADRVNGSLLHILPFDDPFLQRGDCELDKLIKFLSAVLKYGKKWYIKLLLGCAHYTGIDGKLKMTQYEQRREFYFRSQLVTQLMGINVHINPEERVGSMMLFDRFMLRYPVKWKRLEDEPLLFAFYALHYFVCLFMMRGYLYCDSLRPKQFRRDPYSSTIWINHIPIYEYLARKYGTLNGMTEWKPQKHSHRGQRHQSKNQQGHSQGHSQGQQSSHSNHQNTMPQKPQPSSGGLVMVSTTNADQQQLDMVASLQAIGVDNLTEQQRAWLFKQQHLLNMKGYDAKQQRRKEKKRRNHEKKFLFQSLHQLYLNVFEAVGYPKLLHGLYHRPETGYNSTSFAEYEYYVRVIHEHAEKTIAEDALARANEQQRQEQQRQDDALREEQRQQLQQNTNTHSTVHSNSSGAPQGAPQ